MKYHAAEISRLLISKTARRILIEKTTLLTIESHYTLKSRIDY